MEKELVKISGLSKSFKGFKALDNVSFKVFKNDVFGFLGPNGAGKSTSLRCMLSLIKPDSGSIEIFGKPLNKNRSEILKNIGSIIEKPDFYTYLSAKKNLELIARVSGKNVSRSEIVDILDFVGLKGRESSKFKTFSHGMKQRLGIAQALMHNPELIILDEPTTGLDPQGIIDIRNLILKLSQQQGKTVILSSHQLSEIELIANRMVIINKGKTVIEGKVSELLNNEEMLVKIQVDNPKKCLEIIKASFDQISEAKAMQEEVEMVMNPKLIPEINQLITKNNIRVFAIEQKKKLEDYFIKTIQSQN
ncbi:MAG: ABC transporter ATP-binding protein [Crocinitomicaceae bacterium]|nr:ABC transporter ATP-binding protein [Crocinitomicaceae bacterium]